MIPSSIFNIWRQKDLKSQTKKQNAQCDDCTHRPHEHRPERLLFKAPLVLNRKTRHNIGFIKYHMFYASPQNIGLIRYHMFDTDLVETHCNLTFSHTSRGDFSLDLTGSFISRLPFPYSGEIQNSQAIRIKHDSIIVILQFQLQYFWTNQHTVNELLWRLFPGNTDRTRPYHRRPPQLAPV